MRGAVVPYMLTLRLLYAGLTRSLLSSCQVHALLLIAFDHFIARLSRDRGCPQVSIAVGPPLVHAVDVDLRVHSHPSPSINSGQSMFETNEPIMPR